MRDRDIVSLFWKRNQEAIIQSEKKYGSCCFAIAYNILGCIEDSQECVNDTWLHPSKISVIESWSLGQAIRGRFWAVSFSNLAIQNDGDEKTIIAEGPWELKFTLRYKDTSQKIPVNKLHANDDFGNDYQINQIWISPVGIYMKGYQFDPEFGGEQIMIHFNVSIVMKDGTVIPLEDHGSGGHFREGDKKAEINFRAMFDTPLNLEEIDSLLICGTEYKVDLK